MMRLFSIVACGSMLVIGGTERSAHAGAGVDCQLQTIELEPDWRFRTNVAVDGDRAVVGFGGTDGPHLTPFRTFAYQLNGATWTLTHELQPGAVSLYDYNQRVTIAYPWVAATGVLDRDYTNRVLMYRLDGGTTEPVQVLNTPDGEGTYFGSYMAMSGGYLAVSSSGIHSPDDQDGAIYIFTLNGASNWVFEQKITGPAGVRFGPFLALDNGTLAVGAREVDDPSGLVFVYRRAATDDPPWQADDTLHPAADEEDYFGWDIDIDGDRIVVAGPRTDLYLFERDVDTNAWSSTRIPQPDFNGLLGQLQIDNNHIVASGSSLGQPGIAVVLAPDRASTWREIQRFHAPEAGNHFIFGSSLALDGPHLWIGSVDQGPPNQPLIQAYTLKPDYTCDLACRGDCAGDGNGHVDIDDLLKLIDNINGGPDTTCDQNADGDVDIDDLLTLLNSFGPCPQP